MKTIRIIKIEKVIRGPNNAYEKFFPSNLITKIIIYNENTQLIYTQRIYSINNHSWNLNPLLCFIKVINATPREQFLFYLNHEKPFVLEKK